jgi:hypothetical protein
VGSASWGRKVSFGHNDLTRIALRVRWMSELVVPIASTEASFGAIARKLRIGGRAVGNHLTINLTRVTSEQGVT